MPIRIAVIGCGMIAQKRHFPELSENPNVTLTACCDYVPERSRLMAETYGGRSYRTYQELLDKEELEKYVDSYIAEGCIAADGTLRIFPTAKSTEIMMINKTDWEPFAAATGASLEDLKTIEGVVSTAQLYYEWTDDQTPDVSGDGMAFYGRDAVANYFIIGMQQLGVEI